MNEIIECNECGKPSTDECNCCGVAICLEDSSNCDKCNERVCNDCLANCKGIICLDCHRDTRRQALKFYLTYILMVAAIMSLCFLPKIDYPDSTKAEYQPPADGIYSLSHNQDQGSLKNIETRMQWGSGYTINVILEDDTVQALDDGVVSNVSNQDTCAHDTSKGHPLEPEPLDMDELMCQLAYHHAGIIERQSWSPIKFVTYEDSIADSNNQKRSWIR